MKKIMIAYAIALMFTIILMNVNAVSEKWKCWFFDYPSHRNYAVIDGDGVIHQVNTWWPGEGYFYFETFNPNNIRVIDMQDTTIAGITEPFGKINSIDVWPNPFRSHIEFYIKSAGPSDMVLRLYNVSGALVHEAALSQGRNTLELPSIPSGVYLYKVWGASRLYTGKIVKVK